MYRLAIIIVNYRTPQDVVACLASLADQVDVGCDRVVVVDNCSGDDSVERLRSEVERNGWRSWVTIDAAEDNGGFSKGNNRGIRQCDAQYYWLLNPDTVVRDGAIDAAIDLFERHADWGVVGSQLEGPDGAIQCSARRCPTPRSEFFRAARTGFVERLMRHRPISLDPSDEPRVCDWVSGAAMMVRAEVFRQVGLLDEGYFLYFEELDFCERTRAGGWQVGHAPDSRVVHLEGKSTGITALRKRRPQYWFDSRRRFFLKRYGKLGLVSADLNWVAGRCVFMVRQFTGVGRRKNDDPTWLTWDIVSGDVKALVSGRDGAIERIPGGV